MMKIREIVKVGKEFTKKENLRKAFVNLSETFDLIGALIGAIIAFVVVAKIYPTIDSAANDLQTAANNSNNSLIQALAPVIPYLIGGGLFLVIMYPIMFVVAKMRKG